MDGLREQGSGSAVLPSDGMTAIVIVKDGDGLHASSPDERFRMAVYVGTPGTGDLVYAGELQVPAQYVAAVHDRLND